MVTKVTLPSRRQATPMSASEATMSPFQPNQTPPRSLKLSRMQTAKLLEAGHPGSATRFDTTTSRFDVSFSQTGDCAVSLILPPRRTTACGRRLVAAPAGRSRNSAGFRQACPRRLIGLKARRRERLWLRRRPQFLIFVLKPRPSERARKRRLGACLGESRKEIVSTREMHRRRGQALSHFDPTTNVGHDKFSNSLRASSIGSEDSKIAAGAA